MGSEIAAGLLIVLALAGWCSLIWAVWQFVQPTANGSSRLLEACHWLAAAAGICIWVAAEHLGLPTADQQLWSMPDGEAKAAGAALALLWGSWGWQLDSNAAFALAWLHGLFVIVLLEARSAQRTGSGHAGLTRADLSAAAFAVGLANQAILSRTMTGTICLVSGLSLTLVMWLALRSSDPSQQRLARQYGFVLAISDLWLWLAVSVLQNAASVTPWNSWLQPESIAELERFRPGMIGLATILLVWGLIGRLLLFPWTMPSRDWLGLPAAVLWLMRVVIPAIPALTLLLRIRPWLFAQAGNTEVVATFCGLTIVFAGWLALAQRRTAIAAHYAAILLTSWTIWSIADPHVETHGVWMMLVASTLALSAVWQPAAVPSDSSERTAKSGDTDSAGAATGSTVRNNPARTTDNAREPMALSWLTSVVLLVVAVMPWPRIDPVNSADGRDSLIAASGFVGSAVSGDAEATAAGGTTAQPSFADVGDPLATETETANRGESKTASNEALLLVAKFMTGWLAVAWWWKQRQRQLAESVISAGPASVSESTPPESPPSRVGERFPSRSTSTTAESDGGPWLVYAGILLVLICDVGPAWFAEMSRDGRSDKATASRSPADPVATSAAAQREASWGGQWVGIAGLAGACCGLLFPRVAPLSGVSPASPAPGNPLETQSMPVGAQARSGTSHADGLTTPRLPVWWRWGALELTPFVVIRRLVSAPSRMLAQFVRFGDWLVWDYGVWGSARRLWRMSSRLAPNVVADYDHPLDWRWAALVSVVLFAVLVATLRG